MERSVKAFVLPHETWYKYVVSGKPYLHIGFYYKSGGTDGEFKIVWDEIDIQLQAYSDSWAVLKQMPELIDLMAKIHIEKLKPTIQEFSEMLKNIGFKDFTERERK